MIKKVVLALGLGVFLAAGSTANAGVALNATCKDAKLKGMGTDSLNLLKAFGANIKLPNLGKLGTDISKAQSKMTKAFTKAEFAASGSSKGCDTIEDVDEIEAKVEAFAEDVLDELEP
jgi:hypothetical protein